MPSTLDSCEEYFGTRDVYKLLDLTKDSLEKDIKKAYYRISLKVHPDRVPEDEKTEATEKFKVLAKLYGVLTDKNKKALYDEQGIIDDEDDEGKLASWLEIWRKIFKPITNEEIDNYQKEYEGSELERNDIKRAYIDGKGCINYMMSCVPFMAVEDEPRIQEIVSEMIAAKEVPEYKIFTHEPKAKRNRRHKKYAKEALEARQLDNSSLETQIMKKHQERAHSFGSFLDQLMEKYGNDDGSETYSVEDLGKKMKKRKAAKSQNARSKSQSSSKTVKSGRVQKRKA